MAGTVTDNDPSVGLRRYRENFDALVTGSIPCAGIADASQCFYSVTTAGTGGSNAVVTAPTGLTGKSWRIVAGAAAFGVQMANTNTGVNLCTVGQSVTFAGVLPDLALNDIVEYRISGSAITTAQGPAESLFVRFTGGVGSTNDVNYGVRGVTGAETLSATGTHTAGDAFTMNIAQVNCPNQASAVFTDTGITSLGPAVTVGPAASAITTTLNRLTVMHTTSAGSATFWLDDYDWQGATFAGQPMPFITELRPASGIVEGGTVVDIVGGNFQSGATVKFDGTPSFGAATFVNSSLVRATSPPHAAGEVELELMNPDGQTATATYTYGAPASPSGELLFEDFEDEPFGTVTPDENWYTMTPTQQNLQIVGDGSGGKRLRATSTTPTSGNQFLDFVFTVSLCPGIIELDIFGAPSQKGFAQTNYQGAYPPGGYQGVVFQQSAGAGGVTTTIADTSGQSGGSTGPTGTYDDNDNHIVMDCTPGGPVVGSLLGEAHGRSMTAVVCAGLDQPVVGCGAASGSGSIPDTGVFYLRITTNGGLSSFVEIDNLQITGPATESGGFAPGSCFCGALGDEGFGYSYVEDVVRYSGGSRQIGDGYEFEGDATNFAYLGKGFGESTRGMKVAFRIEADAEAVDSVFRAVFSFVDPTPYYAPAEVPSCVGRDLEAPEGASCQFSGDAKGNGKDTESFAEQIEVRFLEVGNDWNVQLFYVSASNGIDARTRIGSARIVDNPNDAETYVFTVDTRADQAYASVVRGDGSALGSGMNSTLPAALVGDGIWQQWFIGYATDNFVNINAFTALDNSDEDNGSTCVYVLGEFDAAGNIVPGIQPAGSPGAAGPPLNGTTGTPGGATGGPGGDPITPLSDGIPPGFSGPAQSTGNPLGNAVAFFNASWGFDGSILFGLAIVSMIVFAFIRHGGTAPLVVTIGAMLGTMVAFFLGLFPGWAIATLIFLSIAVAGKQLFGGGRGEEAGE